MHRVLHSLGEELRAKVSAASTLAEMQAAHRMYMSTVLKRCFLTEQVRRFQSKPYYSIFCIFSFLYTHFATYISFNSQLDSFIHGQTAIMGAALDRLCRAAQDFYKLWQHNVTGKADMLAAPSLGAGEKAVRRSVT